MNVSITNSHENTKKKTVGKKIDEIFSIDAAKAEKKYKKYLHCNTGDFWRRMM